MNEDWKLLTSFFPENWKELAVTTHALKGLRKDKSAENLLRILLVHLACGHSLRETVVRARQANWADLSDVALLKRLRKSQEWLCALCASLFAERGVALDKRATFQVRLFDASNVKEPGKTGSLWRIHYSVQVPSLCCDFFKLTATEGPGTGESFKQFPVAAGDYLIADRGYSTAPGIHYVASRRAFVIVRLNPQSLPLFDTATEKAFPLLSRLGKLRRTGAVKQWAVSVRGTDDQLVHGRVCAIRKTEKAIQIAHQKLRRRASKKGHKLKKETLSYAKHVIVFTTFPESEFSASQVLDWYRLRWQIELVFKRFKQIIQLGHLPKHDEESAKAWLYGKLFVALITEKLIHHAESVSPWGSIMDRSPNAKSLA